MTRVMSDASDPQCLKLCRITSLPQLCVAGGTASGEVEMDLAMLREDDFDEIIVKLKGSVYTMVRGRHGAMKETTHPAQNSISLWTRSSPCSSEGAGTCKFPFEFALPPDLPCSFDFTGVDTKAVIRYFIEVVAVRASKFRPNKKCIHPLAIVPSHPHGAELCSALQFGWDGPWTTLRREGQVRKGLWGDYATAAVELLLPAIDQFPLFTKIPYFMKVITFSKPMKRKASCPDKAIFPTPPAHQKDIEFKLMRSTHICASAWKMSSSERVCCVGGMGGSRTPVDVVQSGKEWVPSADDPEKGSWKQEATYSSFIEFKCSPTFRIDAITNEYFLHAEVHFGGLFNTVTVDVPIVIVSSMVSGADAGLQAAVPASPAYSRNGERFRSRPLNRSAQGWAARGSSNPSSQPFSPLLPRHASMPPPSYPRDLAERVRQQTAPPVLDLPPSYWNSTEGEWETQSANCS